jgi:outer membrane lipoprotein SlyB
MTMKSVALRTAIVLAVASSLGACASSRIGDGNTVSRDATRSVSEVEYGVVIDARQVNIQGTRSGVGAVAGAAVGAAAGSQIGGSRSDNIAAGVVGGIIGAVAGDAIEEGATSQKGIEYIVRPDRGNRDRVVTQGAERIIPIGARVQIIYGRDGSVRIVESRNNY